jgi:hypothetical protein
VGGGEVSGRGTLPRVVAGGSGGRRGQTRQRLRRGAHFPVSFSFVDFDVNHG